MGQIPVSLLLTAELKPLCHFWGLHIYEFGIIRELFSQKFLLLCGIFSLMYPVSKLSLLLRIYQQGGVSHSH